MEVDGLEAVNGAKETNGEEKASEKVDLETTAVEGLSSFKQLSLEILSVHFFLLLLLRCEGLCEAIGAGHRRGGCAAGGASCPWVGLHPQEPHCSRAATCRPRHVHQQGGQDVFHAVCRRGMNFFAWKDRSFDWCISFFGKNFFQTTEDVKKDQSPYGSLFSKLANAIHRQGIMIPEVNVYIHLLVLLHLLDTGKNAEVFCVQFYFKSDVSLLFAVVLW